MRVRIVTPFAAYWNYEVRPFAEGDEYVGDLARHLADNGPDDSVEVLEADPEPEADEEPTVDPEEDPESEDPESEPADAPFPADGTATDVLVWVGDDPERAGVALAAEQERDKPRSVLVKQLTKLAEQA